ncbi:MAG: Crp/Fnr family transcriptional regulator [Eubacteriales bacterium]|nr:Crp/Fnr family transcriptional regulator [Eubacteriales bacterium]
MNNTIFFGINEENKDKLMHCMSAETKNYSSSEIITSINKNIITVGVIAKGKAHLSCIDIDGNERILEYYVQGDVFGEMFYMPIESMVYYVTADTDCEITYIDYGHIVKRCENACVYHSQLVNNLFRILANKIKQYNLHISILGQKNTRKKLQTYLEYQSLILDSSSFEIPITLVELSSYLCVDRCALMREIKSMKDEGLIASKGRKFIILYSQHSYI